MFRLYRNHPAFSIVELLVVIVVIGILAAISLVSYTGISNKAIVSSLQTDLSNNSKKLKMYQADYGSYPTQLDANYCPLLPVADTTKYCIKFSSGNNYIGYSGINSSSTQTFLLVAGNGTNNYQVTNTTSPTISATTMQPGVTPGAVLELRASKANGGSSPGINSPLTTTWTDTSGNNNNGTLTNFGTQTPWGGVGTAGDPYKLTFDGVDDRIQLLQATAFGVSPFAVEFWLNIPAGPTYIPLYGCWDGNSPDSSHPGIAIFLHAGTVRLEYSDGNGHYGSGSGLGSAVTGALTHVVLAYDGVNAKRYRNGTITGATESIPYGFGTPTTVGKFGTFWAGNLSGAITIARIYPFALSDTQITSNYASGPI